MRDSSAPRLGANGSESKSSQDEAQRIRLNCSRLEGVVFQSIATAVVYFAAALIGLHFAIPPGNASVIWPPSGIALGIILLTSRRVVAGVWLGAFLVTLQTGASPFVAFAVATGNSLAALTASELCLKFIELDRPFRVVRDAFVWLGIAMFSCSIAATCGSLSLHLGGLISTAEFFDNCSTWWLGDVSGVMLIAPLFTVVSKPHATDESPGSIGELTLALVLLAVLSMSVFAGWLIAQTAESLLYFPLVLLVWLLFRFGMRVVFFSNVLISVIAIAGTSRQLGAFGTEAVHDSLFGLQVFLNAYAFTAMAASGLLHTGRDSEAKRQQLVRKADDVNAKLQIAHTVQANLLPLEPLNTKHATCVGRYCPSEQVGGDYYDYLMDTEGNVVIMIGDVSGHGLGAALLMAETRAYARALLKNETSIVEVIKQLNDFLYGDLDEGWFVTFMGCRFDSTAQTLEYCGAGHDGTIIHHHGQVSHLPATTIPLGISSVLQNCESATVPVKPGDLIVLCTDGLSEAKSATGELFGKERLQILFRDNLHLEPGDTVEAVLAGVEAFSQGLPQADDRATVVLKMK